MYCVFKNHLLDKMSLVELNYLGFSEKFETSGKLLPVWF